VVDMVLKKKAEEEKRKAEERERKKQEEKKKKEQAMAYQAPEWARVEEEGLFEEEEEEMRARKEELYCVACNKKFKSDKQWKNHEQSKKHRDKIAELRIVFKEEEEALKEADGDGDEVDVGFDFKPTQESDENESESLDAAEELSEELEGLEVNDKEDSDKDLDRAEQKVGSYGDTSVLEAMLSSRKNKKCGYVVPPAEASLGGVEIDDDISEYNNVKKKGRRRRSSKEEQGESTYADTEQQRKPEVRPEGSRPDNYENGVDDKMEGSSISNEDAASASRGDQQKGKNSNPKKNKKDKKSTEKKTTVSADLKSTSKGKKQKVHLCSSFLLLLWHVCVQQNWL
jgi:DnaJ homolog subfamily A member 5